MVPGGGRHVVEDLGALLRQHPLVGDSQLHRSFVGVPHSPLVLERRHELWLGGEEGDGILLPQLDLLRGDNLPSLADGHGGAAH